MPTAWPRFAYACEFLLALVAVFTLWSQVGGQSHLDLMPWYWKLALGGGLSVAAVGLTGAVAAGTSIVNRRSAAWAIVCVLLIAAMATVTYYYHLQEMVEEPEEGTTAVLVPGNGMPGG